MPTRRPQRLFLAATFLVALAFLAVSGADARDRTPGFREQMLQLPGMPAAVIPADVTGDGYDDLVVLVAYTSWGEKAEYEPARFDGIEGLVEVMSVVSALLDRRELRVYPGQADGLAFAEEFVAMEVDTSVQALQTGHPDEPLIAITENGVAAVRWIDGPAGARLALEPLLGTKSRSTDGRFYSEVDLLHDLDGDRTVDLLMPTTNGWATYRGVAGGFAEATSQMIVRPESSNRPLGLPEVRDVTADGLPDLIVFERRSRGKPLVFRNRGGATFDPGIEIELPDEAPDDEEIVYIGDFNGEGRSDLYVVHPLADPETGASIPVRLDLYLSEE